MQNGQAQRLLALMGFSGVSASAVPDPAIHFAFLLVLAG